MNGRSTSPAVLNESGGFGRYEQTNCPPIHAENSSTCLFSGGKMIPYHSKVTKFLVEASAVAAPYFETAT